jgi:hypothetical protein
MLRERGLIRMQNDADLFTSKSSAPGCMSEADLDAYLTEIAPSSLPFGDSVETECETGYQGSGTHVCTDTCDFSPPLRDCAIISCPDLLGAQYGFDFATAATRGVDFAKQYGLSEAVTVQCPQGEPVISQKGLVRCGLSWLPCVEDDTQPNFACYFRVTSDIIGR